MTIIKRCFLKFSRNYSQKEIEVKERVVEITSKYDSGWKTYGKDILDKFNGANFGFEVTTKILNTSVFWELGRNKLSQKYGVQFVQGKVNEITYSDKKVHSIGYIDSNNNSHKLNGFDKIVFWGGIDTINLNLNMILKKLKQRIWIQLGNILSDI